MSSKLKDRIEEYISRCDHKFLSRVPIIIIINGRNFAKVTQLLDKPYCPKFAECMLSTTLRLCSDIEGTLFAYQHNDEIVVVTRNDQSNETNPWYDNRSQKICSVTSAIATLHFNKHASSLQLNIQGEPVFTAQAFEVGTVAEAINTLVYKQQQNFHTSIQAACLYNLLTKYDKNNIKDMTAGLGIDEKIDLLSQECGIHFNDYPTLFRRGGAIYKAPQIVDGLMKNKWHVNGELPIFTKEQSFLSNIFRMGSDIFRCDNV
jgi:tRNA(His) 5'-end guanylyltransferase